MTGALWLALLLAGASATTPDKAPSMKRAALAGMERGFDSRVQQVSATDPMEVLSSTQCVYLEGYGAVLTAQVDLIVTPALNPFRRQMSKEDIARIHARKLARLDVLRKNMREMLVQAAGSLEALPVREQVAIAVTVFYFQWEDASGLPSQIVMHAPREKLLDRASAATAIQIVEY